MLKSAQKKHIERRPGSLKPLPRSKVIRLGTVRCRELAPVDSLKALDLYSNLNDAYPVGEVLPSRERQVKENLGRRKHCTQ